MSESAVLSPEMGCIRLLERETKREKALSNGSSDGVEQASRQSAAGCGSLKRPQPRIEV